MIQMISLNLIRNHSIDGLVNRLLQQPLGNYGQL